VSCASFRLVPIDYGAIRKRFPPSDAICHVWGVVFQPGPEDLDWEPKTRETLDYLNYCSISSSPTLLVQAGQSTGNADRLAVIFTGE